MIAKAYDKILAKHGPLRPWPFTLNFEKQSLSSLTICAPSLLKIRNTVFFILTTMVLTLTFALGMQATDTLHVDIVTSRVHISTVNIMSEQKYVTVVSK